MNGIPCFTLEPALRNHVGASERACVPMRLKGQRPPDPPLVGEISLPFTLDTEMARYKHVRWDWSRVFERYTCRHFETRRSGGLDHVAV